MPALGQTTDELRILAWLKDEGERVEAGETLLEVETDKATLEVEATAAGTLLMILRAVGETVEAGTVLAYVGEPDEPLPEAPAAPARTERTPGARPGSPGVSAAPAGRPFATPAARRLAREHEVELDQITGTGPGGAIERKEVEAFLSGGR